MNLQEKAIVHNKFEFLVVDAITGKEKQKAVAYNTILDQWFLARVQFSQLGNYNSRTSDLFTYISFGIGSGNVSNTDTTLFSFLGRKQAELIEESYSYPTSYVKKQVKLEATEYVGKMISEVGFEYFYKASIYQTEYYYLVTHALLQDSEGNTIVINKTDTDIVFITATFYCTYTPSGFGSNGIYPEADKNYLLKWILKGSFDSSVKFSRFSLPYSSHMLERNTGEGKYTGSKSWNMRDAVGVAATGKLDMPMMTFLDSECNNRIIKHIGSPGVGAITFPNHDIFPPYLVERIPIGTGDGVTTEFNIKAPVIMPESETVYVDNVVKTRDADYVIDYESNCGDWYENYHTAGTSCRSEGVSFGDLASRTPNKNYSYRDPLAWWYCYDSTFYPSSCTVNETNPIKIDFGTAKACNTLKIEILTVPTAQVDNLKIQTSSDGTNWTDVPNMTRSNQVWKFTETSARYWRVFIPSYNWSYTLYYQNLPTRDGQYNGATFFLGKTVPGLKFLTPPPAGAAVDVTYSLEYPFKTANNLLRFTYSIVLQRG